MLKKALNNLKTHKELKINSKKGKSSLKLKKLSYSTYNSSKNFKLRFRKKE
jgi:hypothetical protein